ncbi:uracil-DNA glycosylase [Streptomyces sp. MUM 16J]|nr:uracil-DNA glycosylase [Streptomyces sp. MUM 16J]
MHRSPAQANRPCAPGPLPALLFLLVEDFETVEQFAQPVTGKEGILVHPVLKPLRRGHHAWSALRLTCRRLGTPAHAARLSFSVASDVRPPPPSLINFFRELNHQLGLSQRPNGDHTPWIQQGVLLLNRALSTVRRSTPGAHPGTGWEEVTERTIRALAARGQLRASILWGRDTHTLRPLPDNLPSGEFTRPSPTSADREFFGSRPFSRANDLLIQHGGQPVDWRLP